MRGSFWGIHTVCLLVSVRVVEGGREGGSGCEIFRHTSAQISAFMIGP